jgi:hypothetical protein
MAERPLADPSLPKGTVAVRVVGDHLKDPLAGVTLELVTVGEKEPATKDTPKDGVVSKATTNGAGRATLRAEKHAGESVQLIARLSDTHRTTPPFTVPSTGGVRLLIVMDGTSGQPTPGDPAPGEPTPAEPSHGQPPRGETPGKDPTSLDPASQKLFLGVEYRIRTVEAERIHLTVYYSVQNPSPSRANLPAGGLLLPHPSGMSAAHVAGPLEKARLEPRGVRVAGVIPPGAHQISVTGSIDHDGGSIPLSHTLPLPLRGYLVVAPIHTKLDFIGPGLARLDEMEATAAGSGLKVLRGPGAPSGARITFRILNLPARSRFWAWLSICAAALMLLVPVARNLRRRDDHPHTQTNPPQPESPHPEQEQTQQEQTTD